MLDIKDSCLVVVDVQEKLFESMHNKQQLLSNIRILIKAAKILEIPILWCQQYPKGLGPTVPEIAQLLTDNQPINKMSFSCCGSDAFNAGLKQLSRSRVLLCGIEAHVCVYQTATNLTEKNYHVHIIADAVSSRTEENKQTALRRMDGEGVKITCTEMAVFELLRTAEHPQFKEIVKLIK